MDQQLENIRHSLAHILAAAVLQIFPEAKLGVGPVIANGFYYDFDLPRPLTPQDLPKIEKRMKKLIQQSLGFTIKELTKAAAEKQFAGQPFKLELINDLVTKGTTVFDEQKKATADTKKNTTITSYTTGSFVDLCRGGHVESTKEINVKAFKLTHIAGAYWRGNEKNPMLQRIYGVAFTTEAELHDHLTMMEEARQRDHRKLGAELDLFIHSDLVGKGLPLLTPKGTIIRRELERFVIDTETAAGYQHVITPPLAKTELYKKSGHLPYYKDSMYPIMKVDDEELILRPMTCPHHFMLYKSRPHSYRELPLRLAELAPQFRFERSGELSGLMRARMFTLADAHIFCTSDQIDKEIIGVLKLIDQINSALGLKRGTHYSYRLSLGDRKDTKKYYKDDAAWDYAENALRKALKATKAPFVEAAGEAAFYGPKIDIQIKKVNGQEETAFTVQYDFVMAKRFELTYVDDHGKDREVVVIHRSSIGAFERTMAFLIEHYAGAFPLWLAPVQVAIIPVGENHITASKSLGKTFTAAGLRVDVVDANDTVGYKIRQAEKQKIPYMLVIGDKEVKSTSLQVRVRGKKAIQKMTTKKFITQLREQIEKKK